MRVTRHHDGLTLLITLLLMSVLLGISASLLNVSLKQYQLSGIARASEVAFQAANAGIECVLYYDFINFNNPVSSDSQFDVPIDATLPETSLTCFDGVSSGDTAPDVNNTIQSGEEQQFRFDWGSASDPLCTEVSIYKFHDDAPVDVIVEGQYPRGVGNPCPSDGVCTVIKSRGYNTSCNKRSDPRVVEREVTQVY